MGEIKAIKESTQEELEEYLEFQDWTENPFAFDAGVDEYVLPKHEDIADVAAHIRSYTGPLLIHSRFSGVGKTTLLRMLLEEYREDHHTVYVPEHNVTPYELIAIVADQMPVGKSSSTKLTEQKIRDYLTDYDGDPFLIGIDEFGLNDPDTLHVVQFLNDLEHTRIILTGMTSQWNAIGQLGSDGRAFQRRVSYQLQLEPLSREQIGELVRRRIASVHVDDVDAEEIEAEPFTEAALDIVHERSKGVAAVATAASAELVNLAAYRYREIDEPEIDTALAKSIEYTDPEVETED